MPLQDSSCYPFNIERSETELGRYLVAKRDIGPLELIFREPPVIVGPSRQQAFVTCVECFR